MRIFCIQINEIDFWKGFYTISLFLGAILMYLEIFLYRETFIRIGHILIIVFIVGLITFQLTKNHYRKIYNLKSNFFPLLQSLISWGFISSYLVLATNYYFADKEISEYIIEIKSRSSLSGYKITSPRQPTIRFDYNDFEKELVFYSSDSELVDKAKDIRLSIKNGALGIDIIDNFKLLND